MPSIAFVESALIKSLGVPHGVFVNNVLPVLFERVAFAVANELLVVDETAVVMFGISVVAFRPIPASMACSGRKKKAQFFTFELEALAPSIISPKSLDLTPLIAVIIVCLGEFGVILRAERLFVAVFKFNLVPSSST